MTMKYEQRTYRNLVDCSRLQAFRVVVKETDLLVHARTNLEAMAKELVLQYRGYIESYIAAFPEFVETLQPWRLHGPAPFYTQGFYRGLLDGYILSVSFGL